MVGDKKPLVGRDKASVFHGIPIQTVQHGRRHLAAELILKSSKVKATFIPKAHEHELLKGLILAKDLAGDTSKTRTVYIIMDRFFRVEPLYQTILERCGRRPRT